MPQRRQAVIIDTFLVPVLTAALAADNDATIRVYHLSGNIARVIGSQKDITGRQFIRLSGPSHRGALAKTLNLILTERSGD